MSEVKLTPLKESSITPPAQLAAHFIKMPRRLIRLARDAAHNDPQALVNLRDGQLANSIDLLAPNSPALELLAARPRQPRVYYHSIIGEAFGKGEIQGVVAPETAAHAAGTSALLPMLTLGIPGSPTAAVLLGGLLIWGLQPGPMLSREVAMISNALTPRCSSGRLRALQRGCFRATSRLWRSLDSRRRR